MAGYSGKPLAEKLGIKQSQRVVALNAPAIYKKLLGKLPCGASIESHVSRDEAFIHLFATRRADLAKQLKQLRAKIVDSGIIWISWPKKSSGVATDVTEDTVRAVALPLGLVDTKVCAVDDTWSGLKLMVRRENRREQK